MAKKSEREMLLTQLGEECAEVIQAISKIERFGPEETMPGLNDTNMTRLYLEMNDVMTLMSMVAEKWGLPTIGDYALLTAKKQKVIQYMKYSKECGTVE